MKALYARRKRRGGQALIESVAALVLLLPIIMIVIYAVAECSYACVIKSGLSAAAHEGARNIAIAYWKNGGVEPDPAPILERVKVANIVTSPSQFTVGYSPQGNPDSVTVTVKYGGTDTGLPPFPNPDPLGLGRFGTIIIRASATQALN